MLLVTICMTFFMFHANFFPLSMFANPLLTIKLHSFVKECFNISLGCEEEEEPGNMVFSSVLLNTDICSFMIALVSGHPDMIY